MPNDITNQIHKISPNLIDDRIQNLKSLMPDLFDGDGNLDETALRDLALKYNGDKTEKFVFSWSGKQASKRVAFEPSRATLKANLETCKNLDTTKNLLIEGDNLEVLKLLQKSYYNKVKCIYIDPPYNTGKDFIYPDNYGQTRSDYWQGSGAVDSEGIKLESNPNSSGRYHSNWLNMMQPRLLLARNLMREDGVIFVSIDDHEVHNLRKLMDEVFGEENFMGIFIWNKQHSQQQGTLKVYHEYVVAFSKNEIKAFEGGEGEIVAGALKKISTSNPASEFTFPKGTRVESENDYELNNDYGDAEKVFIIKGKFICKNGVLTEDVTLKAGWTQANQMKKWFYEDKENVFDTRDQKVLEFYFNGTGKLKCRKERGRITPSTILPLFGTGSSQSEALKLLFESEESLFDNPKPVELVKNLYSFSTNSNDIILDFFAGSGTTAQAVMELNSEDGGNRQFILVQIPEKTDEKSEAYKAGYKTIFDITAERVRRAGDKVMNKPENKDKKADIGFKVLSLGSSNFPENTFDADPDKTEMENLMALENYITAEQNSLQLGNDKTDELLLEIALKQGFDLSYTVDKMVEFKSNVVYLVRDETQKMLICLDETIAKETVEEMKNHLEINFVCTKSGLDTTNKWNLERAITKDRLFVF